MDPAFLGIELVFAFFEGRARNLVVRHLLHWWRRRYPSLQKLEERAYRESISEIPELQRYVVRQKYALASVSSALLSTLPIAEPALVLRAIARLQERFGLDPLVAEHILRSTSIKLLQHPRAAEAERLIGVFRPSALHDLASDPTTWRRRVEQRIPGDHPSFNLRMLGIALSKEDRWDAAQLVFAVAAQKAENGEERARALSGRAEMLFDLGCYVAASPILSESITIATRAGLEDVAKASRGLLAWIEMYRGHRERALRIFQSIESYHFLGRLHCDLGQYDAAMHWLSRDRLQLEEWRPYLPDEEYNWALAFNERWLARCFLAQGSLARAHYTRDKSSEVLARKAARAHLLLDRGQELIALGQANRAVPVIREAMEIWWRQGYLKGYAENAFWLSVALAKERAIESSTGFLLEIVHAARPMGETMLSAHARESLRRNYELLGRRAFRRVRADYRHHLVATFGDSALWSNADE